MTFTDEQAIADWHGDLRIQDIAVARGIRYDDVKQKFESLRKKGLVPARRLPRGKRVKVRTTINGVDLVQEWHGTKGRAEIAALCGLSDRALKWQWTRIRAAGMIPPWPRSTGSRPQQAKKKKVHAKKSDSWEYEDRDDFECTVGPDLLLKKLYIIHPERVAWTTQ